MVFSFNLLWTGTGNHTPEGQIIHALTSAPISLSERNQPHSPSITARPSPPKRPRPFRTPDEGGITDCTRSVQVIYLFVYGVTAARIRLRDAGSPDRTSARSGAPPYCRELGDRSHFDEGGFSPQRMRDAGFPDIAQRLPREMDETIMHGGERDKPSCATESPPKGRGVAHHAVETSIQARNLTALMKEGILVHRGGALHHYRFHLSSVPHRRTKLLASLLLLFLNELDIRAGYAFEDRNVLAFWPAEQLLNIVAHVSLK